MCDKILKVRIFRLDGVGFPTLTILICVKVVPKLIGNKFCTQIIKIPVETNFTIKNIIFLICVWQV